MTKKTRERVQLSQESINKILELVYKRMNQEARFAFDSRGISVFLQNTDQVVFKDENTGRDVECTSRKVEDSFRLEDIIALEISSDVSVMSLKSEFAAYTKYSYCFYDDILGPKTSRIIRYAKSIS